MRSFSHSSVKILSRSMIPAKCDAFAVELKAFDKLLITLGFRALVDLLGNRQIDRPSNGVVYFKS